MVCCRGLDNNPVVTTSINCWFLKIVTCVKDRINKFYEISGILFFQFLIAVVLMINRMLYGVIK